MGLIFLVRLGRLRHADLWSMQLVFLTIPFVLKTAWPHDFAFLPFTQAFLAWRLLEGRSADSERGRRSRAGTVMMGSLIIASIVVSNVVFYDLISDFTRYGSYSFLFWANLLLMIAIYAEVLPLVLRPSRTENDLRPSVPGKR